MQITVLFTHVFLVIISFGFQSAVNCFHKTICWLKAVTMKAVYSEFVDYPVIR